MVNCQLFDTFPYYVSWSWCLGVKKGHTRQWPVKAIFSLSHSLFILHFYFYSLSFSLSLPLSFTPSLYHSLSLPHTNSLSSSFSLFLSPYLSISHSLSLPSVGKSNSSIIRIVPQMWNHFTFLIIEILY